MWKTTSILIGAVLILVTLGIVMLASTSGVQGQTLYGNANYFVVRQVVWLGLASMGAALASRINYRFWKAITFPLVAVTAVLLVLCFVPHIGSTVKGSSRWLRLGPLTFQPSELAKFASIVMLSWWMARVQRRAEEFKRGLIIPLVGLGVLLILIFLEPDFGTTMLIATVGLALMFVGGSRFSYLLVVSVIGFLGFVLLIMQNAVRSRRVFAFLDPERYAQNEAFQLINANLAFVSGGGLGTGLGEGLQKMFYLPEAHTDFIFAIIGEELGLPASMAVVLLFLAILVCGFWISVHAPDKFGQLLAFGITLMITLQAAINIAVVTGCMPTKGLPLPFISFGGSSMVITFAMVGVLLNIASQSGNDPDRASHFIKDSAHRL